MYLEGSWRPRPEPPPGGPRMSKRDENVLVWLIVAVALLLLVAPIGGATIVQAVLAAL